MFFFHSNSFIKPQVPIGYVWKWSQQEVIRVKFGHDSGSDIIGSVAFKVGEVRQRSLSPQVHTLRKGLWGHSQEGAILQPKERALFRNQTRQHLDLGLNIHEKTLFKPSNLQYFVMVTQEDQENFFLTFRNIVFQNYVEKENMFWC